MLKKKLLVAFALVGLLPLAPASPAPAQTVEVGEVCQCGVLITQLVRAGKIAEKDANDAWLLCIEVMC